MKHRAQPRTRALRRRGGAVTVTLALAACTAVIYHTSFAAFSTTTANPGNQLTAGVVGLTDNDSNTAMFSVGGLIPGSSGSSCVTLSWSGTVTPPAPVQVYVVPGDATDTPGSGGGGVAAYINWSVETAAGSGIFGNGGACTALTGSTVFGNTADTAVTAGRMLSDFVGKDTYSAGGTTSVSSAWSPVANVASTRVFRFNYKVATDAPNTAMGATAVVKITWETRS